MKKFIGLLLALYLLTFLFGADQEDFPDIYIDESVAPGGVGSFADPYSDFDEINWTTGGDNSVFDYYAGAEAASLTINLQEGEEWRETLSPGVASGSATYPIIVRSYGSGAAPIINGADIITGWVASQSWQTTWSMAVDSDVSSGSDRNYRNILAAGTLSTSGTQIRATFTAHSVTPGQVDGASIGERDGATDDMADIFGSAKFKRFLFSSGDTGVLPAGGTLVSDTLTFSLDETKDYLIATWFDNGNLAFKNLNPGGDGVYGGTADTGVDGTETQVAPNGVLWAGQTHCLSKLEVLTGAANVWKKTGITAQPYIVIFDGTIGIYQTSVGNLSSEFDWYWDDGDDILYVYAPGDPDTEYTIVEAGTRSYCIDLNDSDYFTFQDLKLTGAKSNGFHPIDATNIILKDSEIVATGKFGILTVDSTDLLFQNLHIHNITVEEAIYLDASKEDGSGDIIVEHCNIHDFAENGIYVSADVSDGQYDIILRYNRIVDSVSTWNTGSISSGGGGNGNGIQIYNVDGLDAYYNYLSNTDWRGIQVGASSNIDIYNNVIYGSADQDSVDIHSSDVVNFKNNIIQTDSNSISLLRIRADATNVTISNNRYYTTGNGTDAFNWLGADFTYAQFANWVAASSDANSSTGDPLFVDATNNDFRLLMASPCINAGTDVSLTRDYRGRSIRHAPDIGAYEDPTNAVFMSAELSSFSDLWLLWNDKLKGLTWWEELGVYLKEE